jgi:hypothetical protein
VKRVGWLLIVAACGSPPAPVDVAVAKAAPGSMSKACGGIDFFVSSGNDAGTCHAEMDDVSGRLRTMTCDDGHRDAATLACDADGHVQCAATGTGVCSTDAKLLRPAGTAGAKLGYFAYRCAQKSFFVALGAVKNGGRGSCVASSDRATGAQAMHCDDGAGDSADFVCRDGEGACTFTGTGVCTSDETVVRK